MTGITLRICPQFQKNFFESRRHELADLEHTLGQRSVLSKTTFSVRPSLEVVASLHEDTGSSEAARYPKELSVMDMTSAHGQKSQGIRAPR
jgi:hypothetical protein